MKALIDIGEPFISLESTGDSSPFATIPLHLIADSHSGGWAENCQIPDKIALLLSRGANVEARNDRGETSLHVVFSNHSTLGTNIGWYDKEAALQRHLSESIDILVLMCSAGADVCAIDDQGRSVSDAAFDAGQEVAWTKALKYCGIDVNDVRARPNVDPARSTALSSRYNERPTSVSSKLSLAEYLKQRKPCARTRPWEEISRRLSSSEDDDSENGDYEDDESEYGDWDDGSDNEDYDKDDDESEREDSAEDTNKTSAGREENSVPENGKSDSTYEGRGKAKLD